MGMVEQAEGSAIHRQWLEYIFLAVLLKGKVCNPLNLDGISVDKLAHRISSYKLTCPISALPVFPISARLKEKRLSEL